MKKLVLLGALALSVLSMQAFAEGKPLKIGIEAAYPPFASKAPDGSIVERIPLPISAPTMPCYGGADQRTLFVTSLASDRSGRYQHGRLIALDVGVAGLPTPRFGQAPG